jgi:hypothetical protein
MDCVDVVAVCWQLFEGTAWMHARSYLQGDIKPANCLLDCYRLLATALSTSTLPAWLFYASFCDLDMSLPLGAGWTAGWGTVGFKLPMAMGLRSSARVTACEELDLFALALTCMQVLLGSKGHGDRQLVLDAAAAGGMQDVHLSALLANVEDFIAHMPAHLQPQDSQQVQLLCCLLKFLQGWLRVPQPQEGAQQEAIAAQLAALNWKKAAAAAAELRKALLQLERGRIYLLWLQGNIFPAGECCWRAESFILSIDMCASVGHACVVLQLITQIWRQVVGYEFSFCIAPGALETP